MSTHWRPASDRTMNETPPPTTVYLITCEHGGNAVPKAYAPLFAGQASLLASHSGYDPGALSTARQMAEALDAMLIFSTTTRLLVDLNRSIGHPRLYSEWTQPAPPQVRQHILALHYLPYRRRAEAWLAAAIADGQRVVHISCHSFTPQLNGRTRHADIGLLYDPSRSAEQALCLAWQAALRRRGAHLRTRRNYPYAGKGDGFTTHLRRRFPASAYLGIELEINQFHVFNDGERWRTLQRLVIETLREALGLAPRQVASRLSAVVNFDNPISLESAITKDSSI